ncbi:hypothetical protein P3L10_004981 [Capsicum annuum]
MGRKLISKSQYDSIKNISIDRYQVAMSMDRPKEVTGDLVLKCQLGKGFDEFRSIMKSENIHGLFKKSCFTYFIKLPDDCTLRFPMSMVYGFLKRRIKYARDDKDSKEDLKDKNIPQHYREKLCFAWACEIIPPLQYQFKDYPDEVSHPRILRWLAAKGCKKITKKADLYHPLDDAVVHPWIVPNEQELGMTSYIILGLVDTKIDLKVELIKKELAGATSIRRAVRQGQPSVEALHDQPTVTNSGASSEGVAGGVIDDGGSHPDTVDAASHNYEHVGAQENINIFENTPCTGPSHPYTGLFHPYSG